MQLLVLLVPVLLGFIGFAFDLGRLYMIRAEIKTAANAAALAGAARLIGTDVSLANANDSARLAVTVQGGYGNRYDFGGITVGETTGNLTSEVQDPTFYETAGAATGEGEATGGAGEAGASTAKYVRVEIRAEAPITFWAFLSLAQERKTPILARSVAGVSAPLCTACGIEPVAIQALDATDTTHFGFTLNTKYTLGYQCNGGPFPGPLNGTTQRLPYLLLNRYNETATTFADESTQAYRTGASGLPGSTVEAQSCISISNPESAWVNAAPIQCNQNRVAGIVTNFLCGLSSRFDVATPESCAQIPEIDTLLSGLQPDLDLTDLDDYAAYTGNVRRVITVAIVETLQSGDVMTVLGFRQFLVEPNLGEANLNVNDSNGRFVALYIGSPVPLQQGRFSGCTQTAGPGKVVLHQ